MPRRASRAQQARTRCGRARRPPAPAAARPTRHRDATRQASDLLGRRLVVRRRAAHRRRDERVGQRQAIVRPLRRRRAGEAVVVQRAHQEVAGAAAAIAGEHAAVRLAPCAAGARPRISTRASGSPKPGTGRPQYTSSRMRGPLHRGDALAVLAQAAATFARDDLLLRNGERDSRDGATRADRRECEAGRSSSSPAMRALIAADRRATPTDVTSAARLRARRPVRARDTSCARAGRTRRARSPARARCA